MRHPGGKSFLQLFPFLFLIPLLLVTVGALIYLFFIASAHDHRSVGEIIRDMQSGGPHARSQDAYELAQLLLSQGGADGRGFLSEKNTDLLIRLLRRFPDETNTRIYVIKALGRAGQPAQVLPVLGAVLAEVDGPREELSAAIEALQYTRSPGAVPPLIGALGRLESYDDWDLRCQAILALGEISRLRRDLRSEPIVEELRRHVGDPRREVAWYASFLLAKRFRDNAGVAELRKLVDLEFIDELRGDRNRQVADRDRHGWVLMGVEGLHALGEPDMVEKMREIRRVAKERRWTRLLNTVNEILLGAEREGGKADAPAPVGEEQKDAERPASKGEEEESSSA